MYYPRLKDLREDSDLTQAQVAHVLGINRRTYSLYELGKRTIPSRYLVPLALLYNVSTDFIVGITDTPIPHKRREGLL